MAAVFLAGQGAHAADENSAPGPSPDATQVDTDLPDWMQPRVREVHYGLSEFVDSTSRSIDRFFGTDDSLFVDNQSYLRIRQELVTTRGNSASDLSVRFRLDLPTAKRRIRLLIENEADDLLDRQTVNRPNSANRFFDRQLEGNNSGLGLEQRGTGDGMGRWKNSLGAGVRVRSNLDPYVRVTSQRRFVLDEEDRWELNSFNRLTYFDKRGYVARVYYDLNHPLNEAQSVRLVGQAEWQEERHATAFSQSLEYNQVLDSRTGLRYAVIALGDTARQKSVFDYVLQAYWRRDIHKKFIFLDVVPEWHMPTEPNISDYWALIFRLEVFFGGRLGEGRFSSSKLQ
ncbi:hypothetical protein NQT62_14205 [Limnobacter humi]|uniref:Alginate export domain-containing protein n=1 Tax=Limnobacter humi TaxID=1778671 RepID=A0ABT1WKC9_9BURK|nr:hypothetical protein [Limnobacter humi]MCQ8897591.1 hypothetical protein [Limnobacter humi]